jgi:dienelactone hydrolase
VHGRGTTRLLGGLIALCAIAASLSSAPSADAAIPSALGIPCADQGAAEGHVRFCGGNDTAVPTFDGTTPVDVNVALPPEPAAGPDGPYPMVMLFHGWGGTEFSFNAMRSWAEDGYAVFSMTDRGWGRSCGGTDPKRLTPACAKGYIHLMDTRYEVRDAQHFAGRLVDEGIAQPEKIGAHGGSYGGGMSMALAALRNRVMLPDGSLVPWLSPTGTPLEIAAAQPDIPWTDLAYALLPNGHTLDYVADAPYFKRGRIGVLKTTFVAGLFAVGLTTGNLALPLTDPDADIITWYGLINGGEPYDQNPLTAGIAEEVTTHHSSYYIDDSVAPAPLLISNGWTDDLFPADEAIRFYNRTRANHPGADISLLFSDHGHMRGQNKSADTAHRRSRTEAWFAHYLKGEGPKPPLGVETLTQTCPDNAGSGGPYTAADWASIAPGELRLSDPAQRTILPGIGDPAVGQAYDPVAGGGACATASGADVSGAASYRFDPAPAGGLTLMGSPTVIADISSPGPFSEVAARLVDIDTATGDATLVARGLYRPEIGAAASRQVFQLHPNGWRFEPGHVAKLELLPADLPYGRVSNVQLPVTVSNVEIRLPVVEPPGGAVQAPAPKPLPEGYELAPGYDEGSVPVNPPGGGAGDAPATQAPGAVAKTCAKKKRKGKRGGKKRKRCKKKKKKGKRVRR